MKRTGLLLKENREKKGVSIAEVAHVTKINPKTIEALESGEISNLPRKAFIRGFVQTYAKYLGLNVNDIMALFQEEMGETKPPLPLSSTEAMLSANQEANQERAPLRLDTDLSKDPRSKSKTWILAAAGLVLILGIFLVAKIIQKYENESRVEQETIAEAVATTGSTLTGLSEAALPLAGDTMSGSATVVATPMVTTTTIAPVSTTVTTTSPTTTSRVTTTTTRTTTTTSTTKPKATTTTTRTTTTTSTTKPKATTTTTRTTTTTTTLANVTKGKPFEVMIEALDNVTLGYRIDGGSFQQLKLAPEQVHTFKATTNLNIDVSDGGAITIIYNGQDRGNPGTLGQPIKLKYP